MCEIYEYSLNQIKSQSFVYKLLLAKFIKNNNMLNLEGHLGNLEGGLSRSLRHNYKRVKVLVQPTVNVAKKI